jgi:hypothetical protein
MNEFDVYSFEIKLASRSEAKKLGIADTAIRSEKYFQRYGRKSYPRWSYTAWVGGLRAQDGKQAADAERDRLQAVYGRPVNVRYWPQD